MQTHALVKRSEYYDSVTLMLVAKALLALPGVQDAAVVMATPANKEILEAASLRTSEVDAAGADDLVIVVLAQDGAAASAALAQAEELLRASRQRTTPGSTDTRRSRTLQRALADDPTANLVVISVAGPYAAQEAKTALEAGRHVLLFSDNVPLAEEIALKRLADERGLLCMGPDAGTAIINGVALGFANAVPRGAVGIVGAAGTGIQGVSSALARLGSGVSQALGTGGRDLRPEVGGVMMRLGLRALLADPATDVVVLISKPPAPEVATQILHDIADAHKPVVVCFLGGDTGLIEAEGGVAAETLEEAAQVAAALLRGESPGQAKGAYHRSLRQLADLAAVERRRLAADARWLRGLFCGGTFCYEAQMLLRPLLGDVYSNAPFPGARALERARSSYEHTCLDLGDDAFTQGHLHPMLDPSLRNKRLLQEAADPTVGVILLDVVLGYGAHPDPAGEAAAAIRQAKRLAAANGRHLPVVTAVCGTAGDPQNLQGQIERLREADALVVEHNAAAAILAGLIVEEPRS